MCLELRHDPLLSSCRNKLYLYHHRYYSSSPRIHSMWSNRSDIFWPNIHHRPSGPYC